MDGEPGGLQSLGIAVSQTWQQLNMNALGTWTGTAKRVAFAEEIKEEMP